MSCLRNIGIIMSFIVMNDPYILINTVSKDILSHAMLCLIEMYVLYLYYWVICLHKVKCNLFVSKKDRPTHKHDSIALSWLFKIGQLACIAISFGISFSSLLSSANTRIPIV